MQSYFKKKHQRVNAKATFLGEAHLTKQEVQESGLTYFL